MPVVGWSLDVREAISLQQQFHSLADCLVWVILEQLKEIVAAEILVEVLLCATAIVYRGKRHAFFVNLSAVNLLLERASSEQAINDDVPLLPNPKNAVYSLVVIGGVPVRIQDNCAVRSGQIKSKASHFGCQEPAEN